MDLQKYFDRINRLHFDGCLDAPVLRWNTRLRTSAGLFFPGGRRGAYRSPPRIEIATYLQKQEEPEKSIEGAVAHESIHYWLWVLGRPYGHTPKFFEKMKLMGANRYSSAATARPMRYVYVCPACGREFPVARRLVRSLACTECCQKNAGGQYDLKFKLKLFKKLDLDNNC